MVSSRAKAHPRHDHRIVASACQARVPKRLARLIERWVHVDVGGAAVLKPEPVYVPFRGRETRARHDDPAATRPRDDGRRALPGRDPRRRQRGPAAAAAVGRGPPSRDGLRSLGSRARARGGSLFRVGEWGRWRTHRFDDDARAGPRLRTHLARGCAIRAHKLDGVGRGVRTPVLGDLHPATEKGDPAIRGRDANGDVSRVRTRRLPDPADRTVSRDADERAVRVEDVGPWRVLGLPRADDGTSRSTAMPRRSAVALPRPAWTRRGR